MFCAKNVATPGILSHGGNEVRLVLILCLIAFGCQSAPKAQESPSQEEPAAEAVEEESAAEEPAGEEEPAAEESEEESATEEPTEKDAWRSPRSRPRGS